MGKVVPGSRGLRFEFDGVPYTIEFVREYRQIQSGYDPVAKKDLYRRSKYPYTTVNIWKETPGALPELWRTSTVGAHQTETFTLEKGRLYALRLVSSGNGLSRDFKQALWGTYMNRNK